MTTLIAELIDLNRMIFAFCHSMANWSKFVGFFDLIFLKVSLLNMSISSQPESIMAPVYLYRGCHPRNEFYPFEILKVPVL